MFDRQSLLPIVCAFETCRFQKNLSNPDLKNPGSYQLNCLKQLKNIHIGVHSDAAG